MGKKTKILPKSIQVIESDATIAASVKWALRDQMGIEKVDVYRNGRSAWQERKNDYDLIIIDWSVSGLSGANLFNRYRQNEIYRDRPILITSSSMDNFDRPLIQEFFNSDAIEKPYETEQLIEAVSAVWDSTMWFRSTIGSMESVLSALISGSKPSMGPVKAMILASPQPIPLILTTVKTLEKNEYFEEAKELLISSFQRFPQNLPIMTALGRVFVQLGDPTSALRHLKKAYERSPKHIERLELIGEAHLLNYETREASKAFNEVIDIDPEHTRAQDGVVLSENVQEFLNHGRPESIPRSLASLMNSLGIALVRKQSIAEGIKHYHRAMNFVTVRSEKAKLSFNLGLGYLREGNIDEAINWFESAIGYSAGQYDKARKYCEIAKQTRKRQSVGGFEVVDYGTDRSFDFDFEEM